MREGAPPCFVHCCVLRAQRRAFTLKELCAHLPNECTPLIFTYWWTSLCHYKSAKLIVTDGADPVLRGPGLFWDLVEMGTAGF